jgi:putative flippase GtrA
MEEVEKLNEKYGVFKAAEFGVAGAVGFLVAEGVTLLGVFAIYGKESVPSGISSSPVLLGLDVFAFVLGVTAGFFVNERTTVRKSLSRESKGTRGVLARLARFQGVYALGNAITIGVQLALLAELSLTPVLGNVVGALAAYPVSYYLSMRVVWKT